MASTRDFGDSDKKSSPLSSDHDVEQGSFSDEKRGSLTGRKSSVVESIVAADLLDERYNTTQRGLKSRHAQMIALGTLILSLRSLNIS